ncbi:PQQ-dependent dehydrogenase, methanol/ethanol family [Sphingobium subterraneum]|uniref:PQQ-dependent dehydrogenase (Methanol/ethanol family) n=1 Tax=Sphingobium subterraneum TaxID=627688 RepID=A0A841JB31_9SPHN|nr:PQQ-dependent dehydrogenase, methanol/ethanol family [Sphingobium subterraneum]MBB6125331.1 PQQ-dependent dehydrogenase (methanol/ethanol family) [Sphingobium subterraneum]
MNRLAIMSVVGFLLLAGCSGNAPDKGAMSDWPLYGGDVYNQRYSGLDEINRDSVKKLGLAWYHQFDTDRGQQATPIMVNGVLYVSTSWNKIFAFDAASGKILWEYDPKVPAPTLAKSCCDAISRGVAVSNGRVFAATLDGRLLALDAKTGKPIWSKTTVDTTKSYTITGAPIVAGNLVLIGNGGAEYGVRGYVAAYDTNSGALKWRFYTVPNPEGKADGQPSDQPLRELAEPTWFGDVWRESGGGGTVWDSIVYDPDLDMIYIGVGNGTPHDRKLRSQGKGDNLFLSSIVALKAKTGQYVWHYQTSPGDSWDYTATQHIMLADMDIGGKSRKVLMQAPKNGFFYVLDRTNGTLLSAKPYTKVNWATGVDLKTGKPQVVEAAHFEKSPFLQYPGGLGGHSWHPMAFSHETGLVYIPTQSMPQLYVSDPGYRFRAGHMNTGVEMSALSVPDDAAAVKAMKAAAYGELIAWDPKAGVIRWKRKQDYVVNGGLLATAGGLLFQGDATGQFYARDARTGDPLWRYDVGNGVVAPPMTYRLGGKQYVALMVGWGGPAAMYGTIVPYRERRPGRLMVFALDAKERAPAFPVQEARPVDVTGLRSDGDPVAGLAAYNDTCMLCHGFSATGRFTADLRRSDYIKAPQALSSVVIDGMLSDRGMVSFAKYLDKRDVENIRAYLLKEANRLQKAEARPAGAGSVSGSH